MNKWVLFFLAILLASMSAAIVYHLPVYLMGDTGQDEPRLAATIIQIIFFTLFPIIPLLVFSLPAKLLIHKYQLIEKHQIIIYAAIAVIVFFSLYFWIWNNLPLYSLAPAIAGTIVFTYLRYVAIKHNGEGIDDR